MWGDYFKMDNLERLDGPSSAYGHKWRHYEAEVYKGRDCDTDEVVAIKKAFQDKCYPLAYEALYREISILIMIRGHPNVIRMCNIQRYMGYVHLFVDYIESNLEKFITPPSSPLSPHLRKIYFKQILSGIAHCHDIGIIHRHLEPRFVLVDPLKETVKISEFGEAVPVRSPDYKSRLVDYNHGYMAPELLLFNLRQFSAAADVWAAGCIFAAMVCHKPLFHGVGPKEELNSIFSLLGRPDVSTWPELGNSFDKAKLFQSCKGKDLRSESWGCFGIEDTGLDLLCRMLTLNPKYRITAKEALKHPYFTDTPSDMRMVGKRKFEDISSVHDVGPECGEGSSI